MKHLGIVIAGGFVARNILRSGVLEHLLNKEDTRITLLVPENALNDMKQEFQHKRLVFVGYPPNIQRGFRIRRLMTKILYHPMNWTISSRRLFRRGKNYDREKKPWWFPIIDKVAPVLTKSDKVRKWGRKMDNILFPDKHYDKILKENKPDLLFCASVSGGVDVVFLKAARRMSIPTMSMSKGWDIFLYALLRINADRLLTQNEYVRQNAIKYQMYKPEDVEAVGFPQFDLYHSDEWKIDKEQVLRRMNFSPNRKTIFFGSCGRWSPHDDKFVEILQNLIDTNAFREPTQLIVRPHFTDVRKNRYDRFRSHPHIHVDDGYNFGKFGDNFDVSVADTYWLANIMYHADAIMIYASTLALDATMLNKPVIQLGFGGMLGKQGKDISTRIYLQEHFQHIMSYEFANMVLNTEDLISETIKIFKNPEYMKEKRREFKKDFLRLSDGNATQRIASAIQKALNEICAELRE